MDCKNCKLFNGDCGHHHIDSLGHISYNTPSLSCCNRVGDCEYYQDARTQREVCLSNLMDFLTKNDTPKNYYIGVAIKAIRRMTDEEFLAVVGDEK